MESFKALSIFAKVFKVLAWSVVFLVAVAMVGIIIGTTEIPGARLQLMLNVLFSGGIGFSVFYALSEIIKVLLQIEQNTRSSS